MEQDSKPSQEIIALILQGRKIEAIKVVRETTGAGLAEAKQMVERLQADLAAKHPDLAIPNKQGCAASSSLVLLSTLGAVAFLASKVIR